MKELMGNLLLLQNLELQNGPRLPGQVRRIQRLRKKIPKQILGHYDRLMVRGKKAATVHGR